MMLNAFVTLFSFTPVMAQTQETSNPATANEIKYKYPLDVTMSLSGNYGELRSNHFHGGIDFRVGGVVGAPVRATERGYVSRITVSASGYGNALYITHPNGYVSVYGHLHCFNDEIEQFVMDKQYGGESFQQDLTLTPNLFPVAKGEVIGKAGNSGSSGGPHLHFEIRDTNNLQLNVFERGFLSIPDKTPPVINGVVFYGYSKDTGVVRSYYIGRQQGGEQYASKYQKGGVIRLPQKSYIAIDAIDKQEGTAAKLAVNEYKVYLDTTLIYRLTVGEIPLEKNRYINSLMEYKQRHVLGKYMIKSYVEPGNMLQDRIECVNDGLIVLNDSLQHQVKVEVLDYLKNKTVRTYPVRRDDTVLSSEFAADTLKGNFMAWYLPGFYNTEGLNVRIPQGALYNSIYFTVDTAVQRVTQMAPVWKIHSPEVSLHSPMEISITCSVPDSLASKVVLAQVGNGGRLYSAGGSYNREAGTITGKVGSFGDYTVAADVVPPKIAAVLANNAVIKGNTITFGISDNLSGIKSYRVEIDGHWVLAVHDGKTSKITVPLQHAKIKRGGKHSLVITAIDHKDNASVVKRNFTW